MLALLSPSKRLDFETQDPVDNHTDPLFLEQSQQLVDILIDYSEKEMQELMDISENLAELNVKRYQKFETPFSPSNAKSAIYAFQGDTYIGLEAETLSSDDVAYSQDHLGMLSGLYGLLRPKDLIQPYRLEMGTKLDNPQGDNLYDFWGGQITKACNDLVAGHKHKATISLASQEYIKAVNPDDLNGPLITCHFKEIKNGSPRTIAVYAKRARGAMARYMIQNRIEEPDGLKSFDLDGYGFSDDLSDEENLTFIRKS